MGDTELPMVGQGTQWARAAEPQVPQPPAPRPLAAEMSGLRTQQPSRRPELSQKHQLLFHLSLRPAICYLN